MKALSIVILLCFSQAVQAQTVEIKSGEHDGFARLVLISPALQGWSFSRNSDGYLFSLPKGSAKFDVSEVFKRIATNRLAQIYSEPTTNSLKLVVRCECHARPLELRPGVVVIDIKDGKAPEGAEYENDSNGTLQPPLSGTAIARPLPRPQENPKHDRNEHPPSALTKAISVATRLKPVKNTILEPTFTPSLASVKNELIRQISKGATADLIDIVDTLDPPRASDEETALMNNVRIDHEIGLAVEANNRATDNMTAKGSVCISDEQLNIVEWASISDALKDFSTESTGLVGEFDRPDRNAISRAVHFYLALGFGAEARQILKAFHEPIPEQDMLETLSYIVDLESPPRNAFSGMEVCDTSASLWAGLANSSLPPKSQVAIAATLRTFSALPIHLRRHLGPDLARRFLAQDDAVTARAIRDSILRSATGSSPQVKMLEAEIDFANGNTKLGERHLQEVAETPGLAGIEATAALIKAQADSGLEVDPQLSMAADAFLQESRGGKNEALLKNALALAYASQNRFQDAFALLPPDSSEAIPIWAVLAARGNDNSILTFAIFQSQDTLPALGETQRQQLARRLLDLGFPDQALVWLQSPNPAANSEKDQELLLKAEAKVARQDFIGALEILQGKAGDTANRLRATAMAALEIDGAAEQFKKADQPDEARFAARQQQDWAGLQGSDQPEIWKKAAALVNNPAEIPNKIQPSQGPEGEPEATIGTLAQTRAALKESADARNTLNQLLTEQTSPDLLN